MLTRTSSRALVMATAFFLPSVAAGQILYFPNDATIDYTIGGLVYVGKDNRHRNTSPTVNIVDGADLLQSAFVHNSSLVNMSGGQVRGALVAVDEGTVGLTGGDVVGGLEAGMEGTTPHQGGTILMSGGTAGNTRIDRGGSISLHGGSVNGTITVNRGSTLFLDGSGAAMNGIAVSFDSRAFISGGIVFDGVYAGSNARVSVTGGSIHDTVEAAGASTVDINGGTTRFVVASDGGTVNLAGSHPDNLSAHDYGLINMTGGSAGSFSTHNNSKGNLHAGVVHGDVTAFDQSTINIHGGSIQGDIHAWGTVNVYGGNRAPPAPAGIAVSREPVAPFAPGDDLSESGGEAPTSFVGIASSSGLPDVLALGDGLVQFFGTGLGRMLLDPEVTYEVDGIGRSFRKYALTGVLLDGTNLDGTSLFVQNGTGADFTLIDQVPEPETFVLVGLGLVGVLLAANRRRTASEATSPVSGHASQCVCSPAF